MLQDDNKKILLRDEGNKISSQAQNVFSYDFHVRLFWTKYHINPEAELVMFYFFKKKPEYLNTKP